MTRRWRRFTERTLKESWRTRIEEVRRDDRRQPPTRNVIPTWTKRWFEIKRVRRDLRKLNVYEKNRSLQNWTAQHLDDGLFETRSSCSIRNNFHCSEIPPLMASTQVFLALGSGWHSSKGIHQTPCLASDDRLTKAWPNLFLLELSNLLYLYWSNTIRSIMKILPDIG